LGDKVGGPCSYRDDVEPSAVSETSMPLPQHPLCELPAPLADPQHGQGRARPPTDPFCQGEKVLETPKGRGGGIAETNRHLVDNLLALVRERGRQAGIIASIFLAGSPTSLPAAHAPWWGRPNAICC
jgi:hypothetical protein